MLKKCLFTCLILLTTSFFCQIEPNDSFGNKEQLNATDTLFYNTEWAVCNKINAKYYRIIKRENELFIVFDYYLNDTLQMVAKCKSIYPEIKEGECTYFYENGKPETKGYYHEDKQVGIWKNYNKKGRLINTQDYRFNEVTSYDNITWAPQNQSSLIVCNVNYRFKLNNTILSSGHGLGVELGFNFGYFISQKLLLAPFVGIGTRDLFYPTQFNKNYIHSYNTNYNATALTDNDSIVVNYFNSVIGARGYYHERQSYFGLMIKLPYKHFPIIKLYAGESSLSYKTLNTTVNLKPYVSSSQKTDNDYHDITRKLAWAVEVYLFNGRSRIRNYSNTVFSTKQQNRLKWNTNLLALSVYIQHFDLKQSNYMFSDGYHNIKVPFATFMNPEFTNKYKSENYIGLRLSWGIF
jgi:hypothetical protein